MQKLAVSDLSRLVGFAGRPCVSLYLPARVRLSPLHAVAAKLAAARLSRFFPTAAPELCKRLDDVADGAAPNPARVIFLAPGFSAFHELPTISKPTVVVADSFHIKPLIPSLQQHGAYRVADLSGYEDVFHDCQYGEVLLKDSSAATQLAGGVPVVVFGPFERQERFRLAQSDRDSILGGRSTLTTAGSSPEDLARRAYQLVRPELRRAVQRSIEQFSAAAARGLGIDRPVHIARAAAAGEVELLLIQEETNLWGRMDRQRGEILELARSQDDGPFDDLLDDLAELTLVGGGAVRIVAARHMPTASPVAAIVRRRNHRPALRRIEPEAFRR